MTATADDEQAGAALVECVAKGIFYATRGDDIEIEWTDGNEAAREQFKGYARSGLLNLRIPLPVLAWCVANPEAAKGLAEGTMVAINKPPAGRSVEGHVLDYLDLWSFDKFKPDAAQYALIQSRQRVRAAFDDLRASTPAPSGKRPDPSPGMDLSISNDDPVSSGEAQGGYPSVDHPLRSNNPMAVGDD